VASGGSAGAVVALCAGVMEPPASRDEPDGNSRPDALVLFNPAVTYMPIDGREYRSEQRLTLYRQRWGRSDLPEISAYQQVDRNAPPTIILHGEEDAICPIATIRLFADKMTRCGVRCDLVVYPGQGHGFFNASRDRGAYFLKTMREVDRFLVSLGYLCGDGDVDNWLSGRTGAVPPT
jgi:acetyl esterase/lipase